MTDPISQAAERLTEASSHKRGKSTKTHGMTGTRTYRIWCGMRNRCEDPKNNAYFRYGGAGIRVCERWQVFQNFLDDMGEAPDGHSIDRYPNQKGDYEPKNCRWATPKQQARNMSSNRLITFNGETKTMADWADSLGIANNTLHLRLKKGWTLEEAMAGKRSPLKQRTSTSKLTPEQVIEMRQLHSQGVSRKELSEKYGVLPDAIQRITSGKKWKHLLGITLKPSAETKSRSILRREAAMRGEEPPEFIPGTNEVKPSGQESPNA